MYHVIQSVTIKSAIKNVVGLCLWVVYWLPWIPEPSTVNNKLKRREGSSWFNGEILWLNRANHKTELVIGGFSTENRIGGFSTEPLILFCDWRGLIKESPRWTRAFATFQFTIYCRRLWNLGYVLAACQEFFQNIVCWLSYCRGISYCPNLQTPRK
jgi:hypothetical protein